MDFLTAKALNGTNPYALPEELVRVREITDRLWRQCHVVMIGAGPAVFALAMLEGRRDPPYVHIIDHDTVQWAAAHLDACDCDHDQVQLILGESADVGRNWQMPIDFLLVDGDHSYDGVKTDIRVWLPHVRITSYIMFHDYLERPGGMDGIGEWLPGGGARAMHECDELELVDTFGISVLFRKRYP